MEVVQNEAAEMKKIATQGVKTTKSTKKSK
jgi:hypothetical protein